MFKLTICIYIFFKYTFLFDVRAGLYWDIGLFKLSETYGVVCAYWYAPVKNH